MGVDVWGKLVVSCTIRTFGRLLQITKYGLEALVDVARMHEDMDYHFRGSAVAQSILG